MITKPQTAKYNLSDEQRSHVRFSQSKTGYIVRARHAQGPRGGRVRDSIFWAGVNETAAHREAEKVMGRRWSHPVVDIDVIAVDHLGNVR